MSEPIGPAVDRRDFLRRSALGSLGVGAALAAPGAAPADEPPPIVDTHQHLWDLKQFRLPWLEGDTPLKRDFLMADYLEATKGLGVARTVYMEVDVDPSQQADEAAYVLGLCKSGKTPMAGAVISGRPASDGFAAYLDRFRGDPGLKGVRQVLHASTTPPGTCLDPAFVRGIRLLGDRGLSFDLCMRAAELADGAKLAEACPDTPFVLDHCGNPSVRGDLAAWKADLARVARRPNVVCKVSGFIASAAGKPWTTDDLAPVVHHVLDTFGPDRVVFGGDWPVCTLAASLKDWITALRTLVKDRPAADQRKLFHDNALRVYRLA